MSISSGDGGSYFGGGASFGALIPPRTRRDRISFALSEALVRKSNRSFGDSQNIPSLGDV